ncbi:MAG: glycosyltransferase [Pseudomonadota bacterium]|nr:glycosyltransferase [Pseudomonadota bacterium]
MSMRATSSSQLNRATTGLKPHVPRGARRTILHLCRDLESADPGRETVDLAVLTQRSGGRALIASSGGMLVTEAERAAVRHTRMPLDGRGLFSSWRNKVHLAALVQRERPAIIHAHGLDLLPLAMGLSRTHRVPFIVDLTEPLPKNQRTSGLIEALAAMPCLVRVPSEFMLFDMLEKFPFPSKRIWHIPPGIDLQWYSANSISAERLQGLSRLWRLPEQATVTMVPMPLQRGYGHEVFLEALASLKDENIFSVLIGDDKQSPGRRAELEREVARMELNGRVVMPDFCADWPTAFWLAGIVVAPNVTPNGQNRSLLAAQAIGRPVIVTDSGANSEMIRSGETAWIVPPNDTKALAAALREATHLSTGQRLGLAERTRHFIAENFRREQWFEGTMELYENLSHTPLQDRRSEAA